MELRRWGWIILLLSVPAWGQTTIFNCLSSAFVTTNTSCGVGGIISGSGSAFKVVGTQNGVTPSVSGGNVLIAPSGGTHYALSMMYQTKVNVTAFTTIIQFISNNQNIALTFNNCANNGSSGYGTCGGFANANFSSGASCEGGFSQAFTGNPFPYNVFAMMWDQYGEIPGGGGTFGYSNVQIYQQNQSPCNPSSGGVYNSYTTKFSTSPVAMNSPATTQGTTTGDTYAATIDYDGSTLNQCLVDLTLANGTCTNGSSGTGTFFTQSWSNVSIPSQVDGTTAYMGMVGSSGNPSSGNLEVTGWEFISKTATASPGSTATSAGASTATNPSFSPVAGSYGSAQTVTITSAGSSNICYTLAASGLVITPIPDQHGGCGVGTSISSGSTVSVASSQTLYATAGLNNAGLPSGVVSGAYTIGGGGSATAVTCTPTSGSSGSSILVSCTNSNTGTFGACYSTTTTPVGNGAGTGCTTGTFLSGASPTITISTTTSSLQIIGISSTLSDSTVNTYGPYTILAGPTAPTITGVMISGGKLH